MDFADDRKMSINKMIGIGLVILLHILLVYALVSGLATSAIDVIKKPLEIKIIQAAAPPPPPPQVTPPPPPRLTTPPPPYIPPPLIQVQQPTPPPPVFAVTTTVKPPPAFVKAAPAPVQAAPSTNVAVVCPAFGSLKEDLANTFSDDSATDGITSAQVVVGFVISPTGGISGVHILSSNDPDINEAVMQGIQGLRCGGQGQDVAVSQPFAFTTQ